VFPPHAVSLWTIAGNEALGYLVRWTWNTVSFSMILWWPESPEDLKQLQSYISRVNRHTWMSSHTSHLSKSSIKSSTFSLQTTWTGFNPYLYIAVGHLQQACSGWKIRSKYVRVETDPGCLLGESGAFNWAFGEVIWELTKVSFLPGHWQTLSVNMPTLFLFGHNYDSLTINIHEVTLQVN